MAFKKIVKIWDDLIISKPNIDFLTSKTDLVKFPLTKYDKKIIKDLKDTADRIDCAGIAANQIGHTKRIFIGYSDNSLESYKIYINPRIILKYQNSIVPGYKNEIDHYVFSKLRLFKQNPSAVSDDLTFLRRVSLDVTGSLPSSETARSFLSNKRKDKRSILPRRG